MKKMMMLAVLVGVAFVVSTVELKAQNPVQVYKSSGSALLYKLDGRQDGKAVKVESYVCLNTATGESYSVVFGKDSTNGKYYITSGKGDIKMPLGCLAMFWGSESFVFKKSETTAFLTNYNIEPDLGHMYTGKVGRNGLPSALSGIYSWYVTVAIDGYTGAGLVSKRSLKWDKKLSGNGYANIAEARAAVEKALTDKGYQAASDK